MREEFWLHPLVARRSFVDPADGLDLSLSGLNGQISHADEVVSSSGKGEDPAYLEDAAVPNLPQQRNRLEPSEALFHPLPLPLADGVSRVLRRPSIDRATTKPRDILRDVRRDLQVSALGHEIRRVVPPLRACGHPVQSITCPSRRGSREVGKLVARTKLPRPGLHSMPRCRSVQLLRCVFLAVVLCQHGRFNKLTNSAAKLHRVEPCLLALTGGCHRSCRTPITIQNGKSEHCDRSVIAYPKRHPRLLCIVFRNERAVSS